MHAASCRFAGPRHPGSGTVHEFGPGCCGCCVVTAESVFRYGLTTLRRTHLTAGELDRVPVADLDELVEMACMANCRIAFAEAHAPRYSN